MAGKMNNYQRAGGGPAAQMKGIRDEGYKRREMFG